ncbi:unnamed protein product [Moneuplotes crassus]|uniref:Uncharacterized protein n=1 Tax=Euplotes crassus TaxID=5936 RepID=A0AAD1XB61_EUPCR|nr:unnamed protein product [Moneuplotes crassus]
MFLASHRDLGLMVTRFRKYAFDYRVDVVVWGLIFVRRYFMVIMQCIAFVSFLQRYCYHILRQKWRICRTLGFLLFILLEICCVQASFYFQETIVFLSSDIQIVMLQNSFWGFLIINSIFSGEKFMSAISIPNACYDIIFSLIFSLDITFGINYFYFTEIYSGDVHSQGCFILLLFAIHVSMILVFFAHQFYFCSPYFGENLQNFKGYVHKLYPKFEIDTLNARLIPICDYCLNSLVEPSLFYTKITKKNHELCKALSQFPDAYIKTSCNHLLHPECLTQLFLSDDKHCFCRKLFYKI